MIDFPELLSCMVCPHNCGVNRYLERGFCGASANLAINLAQLHFGEEPPISGSRGSGTIFFCHCNLKCVFCQNYLISNQGYGSSYDLESLVQMMLDLAEHGAHNINLVTPTHYSPQIRKAIATARYKGLNVPIVWNSNAYEKTEAIESLSGLVDIWLPDYKYYHPIYAQKYSSARDYPGQAFKAIKQMYAQSGPLNLDEKGIAQKGVLIRILVLPNGLAGAEFSLRKIAEEIGIDVPLSLMAQYYPAGKAGDYQELSRGISDHEYQKVLDTASELGFSSIYSQELSCSDFWTPKFKQDNITF
ncbi:MAG: radical SAM protein [Candidatus Cloacimonetes bacterium]|nr:radical SAM protein [Candidatus Cloacimonadota bacterium]